MHVRRGLLPTPLRVTKHLVRDCLIRRSPPGTPPRCLRECAWWSGLVVSVGCGMAWPRVHLWGSTRPLFPAPLQRSMPILHAHAARSCEMIQHVSLEQNSKTLGTRV